MYYYEEYSTGRVYSEEEAWDIYCYEYPTYIEFEDAFGFAENC